MSNYSKIHDILIEKSKNYSFLKKCIQKTGIKTLEKTGLDLFSFITRTVIGQQISNSAAESIWLKVENHINLKKTSFYDFYTKKKNRSFLTKLGVSKRKNSYINNIFEELFSNRLIEKELTLLNSKKFHKKMMQYKGIGNWSCNMIEIFYLKKINIWPKNDFVINKICRLINQKENTVINYEKIFSPYLTVLALHFWELNKKFKELE